MQKKNSNRHEGRRAKPRAGGGLVPASVVLVESRYRKSTLVLQTVLKALGLPSLYVSGEESARQLKLRAERIVGE